MVDLGHGGGGHGSQRGGAVGFHFAYQALCGV